MILGMIVNKKINDGENNIQSLVGVLILELNPYFELENGEGFPLIYDLDPPRDVLTLIDKIKYISLAFQNIQGA